MKKYISITVIILSLLLPIPSIASDNTIRLICAYDYTIDQNAERSPTSGESLFTINYTNQGSATIKKQDLGALFYGTVTEEQIYGKTRYKIQDKLFIQALTINRYTGSFELTFGTKDSGLIHFGKCKQANDKLF